MLSVTALLAGLGALFAIRHDPALGGLDRSGPAAAAAPAVALLALGPPPPPRSARALPAPDERPRSVVSQHEAVMRFTAWMREDQYGDRRYFAADDPRHPDDPDDVVGHYRAWCRAAALEEMPVDLFRERLARAPGVVRSRVRLAGTRDPDLIRIRKRLRVDRAHVYRIASLEEMAAARTEAARREGAKGKAQPGRRTADKAGRGRAGPGKAARSLHRRAAA